MSCILLKWIDNDNSIYWSGIFFPLGALLQEAGEMWEDYFILFIYLFSHFTICGHHLLSSNPDPQIQLESFPGNLLFREVHLQGKKENMLARSQRQCKHPLLKLL